MTTTQAPPAPFGVAKVSPQLVSKGKISQRLLSPGMLGVGVQVVAADGGETNLHSHPGVDSVWLVLDGQATFYTTDDELVAVLDKWEAVSIPGGTPYWFETSSEEPLVVLHITARDPKIKGESRVDYRPRPVHEAQIIEGQSFAG